MIANPMKSRLSFAALTATLVTLAGTGAVAQAASAPVKEVLVSHIGRLPGRVFTLEDAEAAGVVLMCPGHRARCVD